VTDNLAVTVAIQEIVSFEGKVPVTVVAWVPVSGSFAVPVISGTSAVPSVTDILPLPVTMEVIAVGMVVVYDAVFGVVVTLVVTVLVVVCGKATVVFVNVSLVFIEVSDTMTVGVVVKIEDLVVDFADEETVSSEGEVPATVVAWVPASGSFAVPVISGTSAVRSVTVILPLPVTVEVIAVGVVVAYDAVLGVAVIILVAIVPVVVCSKVAVVFVNVSLVFIEVSDTLTVGVVVKIEDVVVVFVDDDDVGILVVPTVVPASANK